MKRFNLVLDDALFDKFRRHFPDQGQRTNLLRRCVHKLVQRAAQRGIRPEDVEVQEIVEQIL